MDATLTVVSGNESVVHLVADFAKGLGCRVDASGAQVRIDLVDGSDLLLEVLDYVALSATRSGVPADEPLCRLTYRHGGSARVTLGLRVSDFSIDP